MRHSSHVRWSMMGRKCFHKWSGQTCSWIAALKPVWCWSVSLSNTFTHSYPTHWDNLSGTVAVYTFHICSYNLGTSSSGDFSHMPWQCQQRWGMGQSSRKLQSAMIRPSTPTHSWGNGILVTSRLKNECGSTKKCSSLNGHLGMAT